MKTCFTIFKRAVLGASLCISVSSVAQYRLTQVYTGLSEPIELTFPKDGSNRLFIVEQTGKIRVYPSSTSST